MTDLHDRLVAAVIARRELAEAARQLGGTVPRATWTADRLVVMAGEIHLCQPNTWFGPEHVVAHIAANDPAQILRDTAAHLKILDRHRPGSPMPSGRRLCSCAHRHYTPYVEDCEAVLDVASIYPDGGS